MLGRKRVKRNPEKPFMVSRDFVIACCLAPFGFSASLSLLLLLGVGYSNFLDAEL